MKMSSNENKFKPGKSVVDLRAPFASFTGRFDSYSRTVCSRETRHDHR